MCAAIPSADSGSDRSAAPLLKPGKWARPKRSGAHGLRRGGWYRVVNDSSPSLVILDVRKTNVPVPRSLLEFSDSPPTKWSVVKWEESQRGARRASEANLGLTYGICPACGQRAPIDPPDATALTCDNCQGTFPVDWEHPC